MNVVGYEDGESERRELMFQRTFLVSKTCATDSVFLASNLTDHIIQDRLNIILIADTSALCQLFRIVFMSAQVQQNIFKILHEDRHFLLCELAKDFPDHLKWVIFIRSTFLLKKKKLRTLFKLIFLSEIQSYLPQFFFVFISFSVASTFFTECVFRYSTLLAHISLHLQGG